MEALSAWSRSAIRICIAGVSEDAKVRRCEESEALTTSIRLCHHFSCGMEDLPWQCFHGSDLDMFVEVGGARLWTTTHLAIDDCVYCLGFTGCSEPKATVTPGGDSSPLIESPRMVLLGPASRILAVEASFRA